MEFYKSYNGITFKCYKTHRCASMYKHKHTDKGTQALTHKHTHSLTQAWTHTWTCRYTLLLSFMSSLEVVLKRWWVVCKWAKCCWILWWFSQNPNYLKIHCNIMLIQIEICYMSESKYWIMLHKLIKVIVSIMLLRSL